MRLDRPEEVGVGWVDQRGDRLGVLDQIARLFELETGVDRHQDGPDLGQPEPGVQEPGEFSAMKATRSPLRTPSSHQARAAASTVATKSA